MTDPGPKVWKESLPGVLAIIAIPVVLLLVLTLAYKSSPEPGKVDPGVFDTAPPSDVQKLTELRDSVEDCAAIAEESAWIEKRRQRAYTKVEGDYFSSRVKQLAERRTRLGCTAP